MFCYDFHLLRFHLTELLTLLQLVIKYSSPLNSSFQYINFRFWLSHTFSWDFSFYLLIDLLFSQYSRWCHLKSNLIPAISRKMLPLLFHFSNASILFHFSNVPLLFHFSITIVIVFHFFNRLCYCFIFFNRLVFVSFSSIVPFLFHFCNRPKNSRKWQGLNQGLLSGRQRC